MAQVMFKLNYAKGLSQGLIPIDVKIHAEAHSLEEEWSGRSSRSHRRKLQNRLNQRAYRRRKTAQKEEQAYKICFDVPLAPAKYEVQAPTIDSIGSSASLNLPAQARNGVYLAKQPGLYSNQLLPFTTSKFQPTGTPPPRSSVKLDSWCRNMEKSLAQLGLEDHIDDVVPKPSTQTKSSEAVKFEEDLLAHLGANSRSIYSLPADHLLTLMYYNVFRALVSNVESLRLDMEAMHRHNYPSPWISNDVNTIEDFSAVPPAFRPTLTQLSIPHHPCFDIFPDPAVRDNGILHSKQLPHGKLCLTLAGRETWHEKDLFKRNGLVIWGEPHKVESWEVTDGFAEHYAFLIKGAYALENSSNAWRRLRGEPPILFA